LLQIMNYNKFSRR